VLTDNSNNNSANISKEDYETLIDILRKACTTHSDTTVNQLARNMPNIAHITHNPTNSSAININNDCWLIDSGASHYVCGNLSLFDSYISIDLIFISLLNGDSSVAKHSGVVRFTHDFFIADVLYVPGFNM
jgi:hypothetical protein